MAIFRISLQLGVVSQHGRWWRRRSSQPRRRWHFRKLWKCWSKARRGGFVGHFGKSPPTNPHRFWYNLLVSFSIFNMGFLSHRATHKSSTWYFRNFPWNPPAGVPPWLRNPPYETSILFGEPSIDRGWEALDPGCRRPLGLDGHKKWLEKSPWFSRDAGKFKRFNHFFGLFFFCFFPLGYFCSLGKMLVNCVGLPTLMLEKHR